MRRLGLLAAVLSLALLAAVPAASAAARGDRAAARSFAAAASELARDARAALPPRLVETQRASLDCHLAAIRRGRAAGLPTSALLTASLQGLAIARSIISATAIGHTDAFLRRIGRVRTSDRALRAGRAAWREQLADMRVYRRLPFPADFCPRMDAWVDRGGSGSPFPEIDFGPATRRLTAGTAAAAREARIERAAERMRRLGQSQARADRFTVSGALAQQLAIERSIVAPYGLAG